MYTFDDFLSTLESGRALLCEIDEHIRAAHPQYIPVDIRPDNRQQIAWTMHYRKKPKSGKALLSVFSTEGRLSLRFAFLSSMTHEWLLRQQEFSANTRKIIARDAICSAASRCKGYGGQEVCAWRQYFYIDDRLVAVCPYPWVTFDEISADDLPDLMRLIDMQAGHMTQDAKDIKGSTYTEVNAQRCGEVNAVDLPDIDLAHDASAAKQAARMERYRALYGLIPMGYARGLWHYRSDEAARGVDCAGELFALNKIPGGRYARVTVDDPLSFSAQRAWNYVCQWTVEQRAKIRPVPLSDAVRSTCFVSFYEEDGVNKMDLCVPIE